LSNTAGEADGWMSPGAKILRGLELPGAHKVGAYAWYWVKFTKDTESEQTKEDIARYRCLSNLAESEIYTFMGNWQNCDILCNLRSHMTMVITNKIYLFTGYVWIGHMSVLSVISLTHPQVICTTHFDRKVAQVSCFKFWCKLAHVLYKHTQNVAELYLVQEICIRKNSWQESMSDMQVSCVNQLVSGRSFLSVYQGY